MPCVALHFSAQSSILYATPIGSVREAKKSAGTVMGVS
jgi:hypothetical protein